MRYLGDYDDNATVRTHFNTSTGAGARTSLSATVEEADFQVYKDGSQMTLDAGTITVTSEPNSNTGAHIVSVDMSNDTDFTTGADYALLFYPNDETIAGELVSVWLCEWSCENRHNPVGTGTGLSAVPWNSSWDAEVESEALDALNSYDPPTRAELTADKDEIKTEIANYSDIIAFGTAQSGAATTIQLAASETFSDDELNKARVSIVGGTGVGQARLITDYAGATDTATVANAWDTNPDATSVYIIQTVAVANTAQINTARVLGDGNATPWDGE